MLTAHVSATDEALQLLELSFSEREHALFRRAHDAQIDGAADACLQIGANAALQPAAQQLEEFSAVGRAPSPPRCHSPRPRVARHVLDDGDVERPVLRQ